MNNIFTDYVPTRYADPMNKGFKPHYLPSDKLNNICESCFSGKAEKQGRFLKCISGATNASVGIKSHETRNYKYNCVYNNPADVVLTINNKLVKNGFKFFIYAAKPINKSCNDDSWLLWLVIPCDKAH
jgi:hypothetical protein